jgi:hypothetical protein
MKIVLNKSKILANLSKIISSDNAICALDLFIDTPQGKEYLEFLHFDNVNSPKRVANNYLFIYYDFIANVTALFFDHENSDLLIYLLYKVKTINSITKICDLFIVKISAGVFLSTIIKFNEITYLISKDILIYKKFNCMVKNFPPGVDVSKVNMYWGFPNNITDFSENPTVYVPFRRFPEPVL